MMTPQNIEQAMYDTAQGIYNEYDSQIKALAPTAKTERKALTVQREMAGLCIRAGLLWNTLGDHDTRQRAKHTRLINHLLTADPTVHAFYAAMDEENRSRVIPYLHGLYFMTVNFIHPGHPGKWLAELAQAEASGDVQEIFELKLKIGTVSRVMSEWRTWWNSHADELPALPALPLVEEVLADD